MQSLAGWRHVQWEGTTYLFKKTCHQNIFKIVVSDLIHVWVKNCSEDEVLQIFQNLNPLIECNDNMIVYKVWSLVDAFLEKEQESSSSSLDIRVMEDSSLHLKFRTVIDGHAFKLHFQLCLGDPQMFFKEITLPLLSAARELLVRQDLLFTSLEKKDVEIAQYKLEGAVLSRHSVETRPFTKNDFVNTVHYVKGVSNPCEDVLKVLNVVNLESDIDLMQCQVENQNAGQPPDQLQPDPLQDQSKLPLQVMPKEETLLNDNKSKQNVKSQFGYEQSSDTLKPGGRDNSVPRVAKKKRTKLNL